MSFYILLKNRYEEFSVEDTLSEDPNENWEKLYRIMREENPNCLKISEFFDQPKEIFEFCKVLANNQGPSQLIITECYFGEEFFKDLFYSLRNNNRLNKLCIDANSDFIGSLFEMLMFNKSITKLTLESGEFSLFPKGCFHSLKYNQTLTYLDIRLAIYDEEVSSLCEALRENISIRTLSLDLSIIKDSEVTGPSYSKQIFDSLNENLSIEDLTLTLANLETDNSRYLQSLLESNRNITSIDISYGGVSFYGRFNNRNDFSPLSEGLEKSNTLLSFHLSCQDRDVSIPDQDAKSLATAIEKNVSIIDLGLNSIIGISRNSFEYFSKAIELNRSVENLTLTQWENRYREAETNPNYFRNLCSLSKAFRNNNVITKSHILLPPINDKEGKYISELFSDSKSITTLKLSHSGISSESTESLSQLLVNNHYLTDLDLSSNEIDCSSKTFCDALNSNKTLTRLNLRCNRLYYDKINSLLGSLKNNTSLTSLNLSNNSIMEEGLVSVANWLKCNKSLEYLNLRSTRIMDIKPLVDAFETNKTLAKLDISHNDIGLEPSNIEYIYRILELNPSLSLGICGSEISYDEICNFPADMLDRISLVKKIKEVDRKVTRKSAENYN